MAAPKAVWGIDVGQYALKALKLRDVDGELRVEALDIVEHPNILSQPDAGDRRTLIRNALEQFLARNNVGGATVAVSVPGQTSFTRFVKLPPVETKKIPDIVRFEAEQQIPFPIEEVIWRYQTFQDPDSPDVEVGIFAMKRLDVDAVLSHFTDVGVAVDVVQMAPLSLYNFMTFDSQLAADGATLLADVGAEKTDLVVADGTRIWTRTIQIGGNSFTQALVRVFKLSFAKAEKLKCTAATSKYARQIFQAMRPVFADLVQEIQRSIGFYTSLHRETRFTRLLGLGNGFRLPGLQKFLEKNLDVPVVRIDSYNKPTLSSAVNAPTFTENVLSFAVAYGLAVQSLGLTRIETNLLPDEIAHRRQWAKKRPWFAAAAVVLLAALLGPLYRAYVDRTALAESANLQRTEALQSGLQELREQHDRYVREGGDEEKQIEWYARLHAYRTFWPEVLCLIGRSVQAVAADQWIVDAYTAAGDETERAEVLRKIKAIPRRNRKILIVDSIQVTYLPDVSQERFSETGTGRTTAGPPGAGTTGHRPDKKGKKKPMPGARRGFKVLLTGRTPLPQAEANNMLSTLRRQSENIARALQSVGVVDHDVMEFLPMGSRGASAPRGSRSAGLPEPLPMAAGAHASPAAGAAADSGETTLAMPDPFLPDEDMSDDTCFKIGWILVIESDGVKLPTATEEANGL
ncbi:MAG: type IV pilus assembly protein PilM [Planctomycetota bacterium]|nr:type IV pilus assembly protein PilM [Planctomycetota bacterium]